MASRPALSTAPDALHLTGALLLLVRAVDQRFRAETGTRGLTLSDIGVLGQIERGVDGPSQIARVLRLDPARVTHLVDRLVTHGCIVREDDPSDRRRCHLRLTALGREQLERGRADARAAMESLLDGLSAEERAGLRQGLAGVCRVLHISPAPADEALQTA